MPDYQKGKVYRIISEEGGVQYIGSTIQTCAQRMTKHRENYNKWRAAVRHIYYSSFEVLQFDDCKIELLETFPCNSKAELEARENFLQRKMKNTKDEYVVVNQVMAGAHAVAGGKREYQKKYMKEYREKNPEYMKEYLANNREQRAEYNKKYRANNKEEQAEYDKERYKNNREEILEKNREKIRCEVCDCEMNRSSKYQHEKSIKHKDNLLKNKF